MKKYLILNKKKAYTTNVVGFDDLELFEAGEIRVFNLQDETEMIDGGDLFRHSVWKTLPAWSGPK